MSAGSNVIVTKDMAELVHDHSQQVHPPVRRARETGLQLAMPAGGAELRAIERGRVYEPAEACRRGIDHDVVGDRLADHGPWQMSDHEWNLLEESRVCVVSRQCGPIIEGGSD